MWIADFSRYTVDPDFAEALEFTNLGILRKVKRPLSGDS